MNREWFNGHGSAQGGAIFSNRSAAARVAVFEIGGGGCVKRLSEAELGRLIWSMMMGDAWPILTVRILRREKQWEDLN